MDFAIDYIHAEDEQTNYVDIGPVNKVLNMYCCWLEAGKDATAESFQRHLLRVADYLWVAEDGLKMQVGAAPNGADCPISRDLLLSSVS